MPYKSLSAFLLATVLVFGGCSSRSSGRNGALDAEDQKTPVIAEVGGQKQYKASFERFLKSRLSDLYQQQSPQENELLQSSLLDEFLARQVILQEAASKGIQATDDELRKEISDQHHQTNVEGNEKASPTLVSTERAAEIGNDMIIWKFYKNEVVKNAGVSPDEVRKFYQENPKKYPQQPSFCVREIKVNEAGEAASLRKTALDKPADFAILAKEHSQSPSKGDLSCYRQGDLPPVLENAVMPLKLGGISTVVQSNFGYHIFQMVKKSDPLPFEKISKKVEEDLLRSRNQSLIDDYIGKAVAKAKIRVYSDKLGFNYSGKWKG